MKIKRIILLIASLGLLAFSFVGCQNTGESQDQTLTEARQSHGSWQGSFW